MASESAIVVDKLLPQDRSLEVRVKDIITTEYYRDIKKEFGVVGDGVHDDSDAIQAALDSGRALVFPEGKFLITKMLTASGTLRIAGAGRPSTQFVWAGSGPAMLKHTPSNGYETFDLTDFSVVRSGAVVAMQFAIWIDSSAQLTTDTYKGMRLVGQRELRRGRIQGVDILPGSATEGFYGFIRATSTINWSLRDFMFEGASSAWASEGIAVDGDGAVVDIHVANGWQYNVRNALYCPDYVEAIYVDQCEFVNVDYGLRNRYSASRSVLAESVCGSNAIKLGPMHVNAKVAVADAAGADYLSAARMLIVLNNSDSPSQLTGYNLERSNYASVDETNIFVTGTGTVANNAVFGVVGNNCPGLRVHDLTTSGCFVNTLLLNGTVSGSFDNLRAANSGSTAVALQFNSTDCVDNDIGQLSAETTRVLNAPAGNRFKLRQYAANVNVTIDAGQVANVTIPAYQFSAKPVFASLIARDGANMVAQYNLSNSTATLAQFNVTNKTGGTVSNGTYGCTLLLSEGF